VGELIKVVKVIKTGELTRKVKLKGVGATAGAKAAIEAAGGSSPDREGLQGSRSGHQRPTSWPRAASSATCVAGSSSCCWRWWSTASGRTSPCPASTRTSCAELFKGQQGGILNLFNMFSGGALSRFTVFALGIMPYISASIIMQLMTYVVPTLEP
jgi:hypothetical protein